MAELANIQDFVDKLNKSFGLDKSGSPIGNVGPLLHEGVQIFPNQHPPLIGKPATIRWLNDQFRTYLGSISFGIPTVRHYEKFGDVYIVAGDYSEHTSEKTESNLNWNQITLQKDGDTFKLLSWAWGSQSPYAVRQDRSCCETNAGDLKNPVDRHSACLDELAKIQDFVDKLNKSFGLDKSGSPIDNVAPLLHEGAKLFPSQHPAILGKPAIIRWLNDQFRTYLGSTSFGIPKVCHYEKFGDVYIVAGDYSEHTSENTESNLNWNQITLQKDGDTFKLLSWAWGSQSPYAIRQDILSFYETYTGEVNHFVGHRTADRFIQLFTDDVVALPPGHPRICGKENLRQFFETTFLSAVDATQNFDLVVNTVDIFSQKVVNITLTARQFFADGKVLANLKGLNQVRLEKDGRWRISKLAWNADT